MRLEQLPGDVHLTYCTNIHAGESWPDICASLATHLPAIKAAIAPDRPFGHALHLMYEGEFRHVPVVEDGRPLGMVSARDALGPDLKQFISELDKRTHNGEIHG